METSIASLPFAISPQPTDTMPSTLTVFFTPFLLFLSVPLLTLAALTTTLAFSTLLIRVLIVYAELFAAVLQNQLSPSVSPAKASPPLPYAHLPRRKSHRSSDASSGSLTPRLPPPQSIYTSTPLVRDFEGVGGWRFPGPDDENEEAIWTGMNARLELPFVPPPTPLGFSDRQRKHERSLTSSSLTYERPLSRRGLATRSRPVSAFVSGTVSPESVYGGDVVKNRSLLALEEAGRIRLERRKSSSSSAGGSVKTTQFTTGGD